MYDHTNKVVEGKMFQHRSTVREFKSLHIQSYDAKKLPTKSYWRFHEIRKFLESNEAIIRTDDYTIKATALPCTVPSPQSHCITHCYLSHYITPYNIRAKPLRCAIQYWQTLRIFRHALREVSSVFCPYSSMPREPTWKTENKVGKCQC
jgi:hypothetical protein